MWSMDEMGILIKLNAPQGVKQKSKIDIPSLERRKIFIFENLKNFSSGRHSEYTDLYRECRPLEFFSIFCLKIIFLIDDGVET